MIAGAVMEGLGTFDQLVSLQVTRFGPDHPEGIRMTQGDGRYHLGAGWGRQGLRLYPRYSEVSNLATLLMAEFEEQLHQSAPGWLASRIALRLDGYHFPPKPITWYARRPCGIPSGFALWVDPVDSGVTYLLTIESLSPEEA